MYVSKLISSQISKLDAQECISSGYLKIIVNHGGGDFKISQGRKDMKFRDLSDSHILLMLSLTII